MALEGVALEGSNADPSPSISIQSLTNLPLRRLGFGQGQQKLSQTDLRDDHERVRHENEGEREGRE